MDSQPEDRYTHGSGPRRFRHVSQSAVSTSNNFFPVESQPVRFPSGFAELEGRRRKQAKGNKQTAYLGQESNKPTGQVSQYDHVQRQWKMIETHLSIHTMKSKTLEKQMDNLGKSFGKPVDDFKKCLKNQNNALERPSKRTKGLEVNQKSVRGQKTSD